MLLDSAGENEEDDRVSRQDFANKNRALLVIVHFKNCKLFAWDDALALHSGTEDCNLICCVLKIGLQLDDQNQK